MQTARPRLRTKSLQCTARKAIRREEDRPVCSLLWANLQSNAHLPAYAGHGSNPQHVPTFVQYRAELSAHARTKGLRMTNRRIGAALTTFVLGGMPSTAGAYTIASELTDGCHEQITSAALRRVRKDLPTAAPLAITKDERALVDDLQFTPDGDMRDLGGATLLVAVRDIDLKGSASDDLSALAEVHGNPNSQYEHCLRALDDDEPDGSKTAIDTCRAFIRAQALTALEGLDDQGMPDLGKRTPMTISLSIRGTVHAPLPTYYVAAGQAIHTIEDSFTHTYRSADSMQITVALNWIDQVNGTLVESRDGPAHAKALDRCDDQDELRKTRRLLATEAATSFLQATLDPNKTHDQKMAAVDAALDRYVGYVPGCSFANNWCDAPENQYKDPAGCSCSLGNGSVHGRWGTLLAGGAVVVLAFRRTRRRRKLERGIAALAVFGALSLGATGAGAEPQPVTTTTTTPAHRGTQTSKATPETTTKTTTTPSPEPGTAPTTATVKTTPTTTTATITTPTKQTDQAAPPPTIVSVAQPGPADSSDVAFGAYAGLSGSIERPALAGAVGARLRATRAWAFGLDGEWNPWIAFNGTTVRRGAVNVYGTAMLRFPLAYERFNLRVSASVGGSYLLTDLYGAPSGTIGLFFGASPLSVEWKLSRVFYLIINPINFAMPIPQLSGVPFLYPQYRSTLGIEVYAG